MLRQLVLKALLAGAVQPARPPSLLVLAARLPRAPCVPATDGLIDDGLGASLGHQTGVVCSTRGLNVELWGSMWFWRV